MTNTIPLQVLRSPSYRPSRVGSNRYRQSLQQCEDFAGLEENTNRYELLLLVKRVGKAAEFSPRMIQLLDYYMAFTRDLDWEQGGRPIVYQSLGRTALDLGVSERQIQHLEKRLFEAGAITWNDSGNHKRYGQRDQRTGRLLYAFGVDLTPLAFLKPSLEELLREKELYERAWLEAKRQVSWRRRQIRGLLAEWGAGAADPDRLSLEQAYAEIAKEIRTHLRLPRLRELLEKHKSLHDALLACVAGVGESAAQAGSETKAACGREKTFVHKQPTTHESLDKSNTRGPSGPGLQESDQRPSRRQEGAPPGRSLRVPVNPQPRTRAALILATGLQHITLAQALRAASDRYRDHLPVYQRPVGWSDVVEASYRLLPKLRISQAVWAEGCQLLGRNGAALCVLVIDQAAQRIEQPVLKPAAYFRAMLGKGRAGELRLYRSVLGMVASSERGVGR